MGWWQRLGEMDDRVNRRLGIGGTVDERATFAERQWWFGPVAYGVATVLVIVLDNLTEVPTSHALLPPLAMLVFQSGFYFNERLRALDAQSRYGGLRWRHHEPAAVDDQVTSR